MVRRPRRPTHEDEPDRDPEHEGRTDDYEPPPEPAPEPAPEPQEEPMPQPQSASGNGGQSPPLNIGGAAISVASMTTDQQAIIAQQAILIATQAQAVRDLEAALNLAPPPPTTAPAPPGPTVNLTNVIQVQTAAIRTQAAYTQHLVDLQTALAG